MPKLSRLTWLVIGGIVVLAAALGYQIYRSCQLNNEVLEETYDSKFGGFREYVEKEAPPTIPRDESDNGKVEVVLSAAAVYPVGADVVIQFKVHNGTSTNIRVGRYHTPFEGMRARYLKIIGPDGEVSYSGIMAKRPPPGPEDFFTLDPASARNAEIVVNEAYELPGGSYTVQFVGNESLNHLPDSNEVKIDVE